MGRRLREKLRFGDTKLLGAVFLFLLAAFLCFYKLGYHDVVEWDEATNADVVYESLHSDDPLTLKFDGKPFFEKTPLWYYLTMLSVKVFGFNAFALRFVTALAGFCLIVLVYFMGEKLYSHRAGVVAGFSLLATSQLFFYDRGGIFSTHHMRSADGDILQIFFLVAAMYAVIHIIMTTARRAVLPYIAAICSALAVLTKGPLGVLPLAVLGIFIVWYTIVLRLQRKTAESQTLSRELQTRENMEERLKIFPCTDTRGLTKHFALALGLFVALVLPWHVFMFARYGRAFIDQYLSYHLWQRFASSLEGHGEPWWFYLRVLFDKRIFWGLEVSLLSAIVILRDYVSACGFKPQKCPVCVIADDVCRGEQGEEVGKRKVLADRWLLLISLLLFLIPTLASTKLAWYILPLYPFLALLTGRLFERGKVWLQIALVGMLSFFITYNFQLVGRQQKNIKQTFFEQADVSCKSKIGFVSTSIAREEQYFIHRYLLSTEATNDLACLITNEQTRQRSGYNKTAETDTLVLWQKGEP